MAVHRGDRSIFRSWNLGFALESIASSFVLIVSLLVQYYCLSMLYMYTQVGVWSRGQRPLHVLRSHAVKASTVMDRIKIKRIALLVFLCECVLFIVVVVL